MYVPSVKVRPRKELTFFSSFFRLRSAYIFQPPFIPSTFQFDCVPQNF